MSLYLRQFQHLLPNARAWRLTIEKKLRLFFEGLSESFGDVRVYTDGVYEDVWPDTTDQLDEWDKEFGLPSTGLSAADRRSRLTAAWRATGGQSPRYIQDTLQAFGFDVYVHEWFNPDDLYGGNTDFLYYQPNGFDLYLAPDAIGLYLIDPSIDQGLGNRPCRIARDPNAVLNQEPSSGAGGETGGVGAECGIGECGTGLLIVDGYVLSNKIVSTGPNYLTGAGEAIMEAGEPKALSGNYEEFTDVVSEPAIPTDPAKWAYFLYIGGPQFPGGAQVPIARKDEFEDLCLKITPAQQWLGLLVEYV